MKNYEIIEKIYESANSLVYRAILKSNAQPIIVKTIKENYPTASTLTRYKQEYEITRSLNSNNIIKAYDLQRHENKLVLLMEEFEGKSLNFLVSQHQLSLEEFLTIAIKITESLITIHTANIIHKDINPSNIVYNQETKQLKIIDFGISTKLSQENQTFYNSQRLEGTLAYIAPEQTGRMNRGIDYRSDFYSLGVTYYKLLTNKLPFETTNPIELVHCHIAQSPEDPYKLISSIPLMVSQIIMKLLAKNPEERYQSARGIKIDLEHCLKELQTQGKITQFLLGSHDVSDRFCIPQKLYGREKEVIQLFNSFERVRQGNSEMILISGYSGIGKTALVNELHKPITKNRGYFIRGKFEQLKRDIPYLAISQAFQDFVLELLTEPEITLVTWKNKILEALGNNGQIIINIIPEVEKIIGKQPPIEQLGNTENQNRFILLIKRFINVFSQKEHPLVIFLDDLQWADLPSLNLIEHLITQLDQKYLLIVGAYRDNEVSPFHPLTKTIEKIIQSSIITEITLSPLSLNQVNQWIADTLNCSREFSESLAKLLLDKTGGNPFFLIQLLLFLHQEKYIVFNFDKKEAKLGFWQWNIEQIKKSISITDNVVELMVNKIEKLDNNTQNILKLAACIGSNFDLKTISIINNKSQIETAKELYSALDEGLIIPLDNNYKIPLLWNLEEKSNNIKETSPILYSEYPQNILYKFLHDRVQQAAYSLISDQKKKIIHLKIGRLILEDTQEDQLEERIFDIVNQFNEGAEILTEELERDKLTKLNLIAGKKAKASTAYQSALAYFEMGINLLSLDGWKKQYDLTMMLHLEKLESLFLNTLFEEVERFAETTLKFSQNNFDRSKVYQIQSKLYSTQLQPTKAIETTKKALYELDVYLPIYPDEIEESINQRQEEINLYLSKMNISDLVNLSVMNDNQYLLLISVLQNVISASVTTNYSLFIWTTLTQTNLCFKRGNPPQSAIIYVNYGMIFVTKNIDLGYEFGNLSLKLLIDGKASRYESRVIFTYYGTIWHWKKSLRSLVAEKELIYATQKGIDSGDYESAGFAAITLCLLKFFGGHNLEDVFQIYTKYENLIMKTRHKYSTFYIGICFNISKALTLINTNQEKSQLIIGDSQEEEDKYIKQWIDSHNEWLLFIYYFAKTIICYFSKDYNNAYDYGLTAEQYKFGSAAYILSPQYNFYSSLSYLAHHNNCDPQQQQELLENVEKNQKNMKIWAEHCTENFQHKYDLVEAEKARILGQNWQAQELYEKAIQGAKKYEFIHEEALAYERASEFYSALGRKEIGQFYLRNAYHCYINWGAKAKVKQLEEEYSQYLLEVTDKDKSKVFSSVSTTVNDGKILDLMTIIKASQAISSEIQLEKLLQNLMRIVIENAGAQKGFLILKNEVNLVIEAQAEIDSDQAIILQSIPIEFVEPEKSIPILPTKIINYVAHTQKSTVLNNAVHEGQFINDPYIIATQTKSVLCIPLLNQGQLSGIVYLENNLTTGAFTSERVELLNILSAQIAISIDNSRLYQTLKQTEIILKKKAFSDPLTGLGNRRFFSEKLSGSLVENQKDNNQIAIMFLDLDNFKNINDTLGHNFGDELLRNFGKRLKSSLREEDLIARWGGDEFTILLKSTENLAQVKEVAQRLLDILRQPFQIEGHRLHIKSSIGIAIYPQDGKDAATLLKNADAALYKAKEWGRNSYRFYSSAITSISSERLKMENLLHQALEKNEFILYYQPQLNINTGKIYGMEALVRWQQPEMGLIPPLKFIPLAEQTGLITSIGEWVLRRSCQQNRDWQKAGLSPFKIGVNLAVQQIQQSNFTEILANILKETELDPCWLELEITETSLMQNVNQVRRTIEQIQQMGVDISIDDFGTGYSSLGYLKQFPFQTIKIDRAFVKDLKEDNAKDLAIISAVISLGRGFNLKVIAEGVETQEQLELLKRMQCELIQGYYFSRPLPEEKVIEFIEQLPRLKTLDFLHSKISLRGLP